MQNSLPEQASPNGPPSKTLPAAQSMFDVISDELYFVCGLIQFSFDISGTLTYIKSIGVRFLKNLTLPHPLTVAN